MNCTTPRLVVLASLLLAFALPIFAQSSTEATGAIVGRVFNPINQEYVANAEVHVEGTNLTVPTERGGYFNLPRVPAGTVTLTVNYAGFSPTTTEVRVNANQTTTQDFELGSVAATGAAAAESVIKLETLVVTTEKDGNAKALQHQRNSMNLSRSVASDAFGNVTEGNVGEFLKYLPGVELEYVEADTRGPRLGGMSSEYASVTLDGRSVASADSFGQYVGFENSRAGTANRSFGFDSISISSIESIEINRVTPASMNADAPAGNINLKTRRGFDSKGRRITFDLSSVLNSEEFTLKRTVGPDDSSGLKYRPNFSFGYSDVLLNNRLGVSLAIKESNLYNEQYRVDHNFNRTPTATDPRGQVLNSILLKDGPKWTERGSLSATLDFRATEHLTLSLTTLLSRYHGQFYNRQVTMTAGGTRATVVGDGVLVFGSATPIGGSIVFGGGNGNKFTNTLTVIPSFEYRKDSLTLDGSFTSSHSRNDYDNLAKGTVGNSNVANVTGIGFLAMRSNTDNADWKITQTGGPDWTDLSLQKNPRISDDNRQNTIDIKSGDLNARYVLPLQLPTFLQAGAKWTRNDQLARDTRAYDVWQYVGPGGGTTGSFANYPSPFVIYQGSNQPQVQFTSINGGGAPAFPDRDTLGTLFHTNPEWFVRSLPTSATVAGASGMTLANYESGMYLNNPTYDIVETITSGYVMANMRIRKLQVQGGVRYEKTELESSELDPYSNQEVAAAGHAVTAAGAPNSVAAMDYKYSRPRVVRRGTYDDLFPSLSGKYTISRDLIADLGWGKTIRRPNISDIAATRQIDDNNLVVTTANPNLLPERSEKIAGSLSYFFGRNRVNNVQVVATRTKTKNQTLGFRLSAEEYGNTDPELASYEFQSFTNANTPVTWNTMEYSYLHYLLFLPRILQSTSIRASYTRVDLSTSNGVWISGVVPNSLKGTLGWSYGRFSFNFSAIWSDDSGPWLNNLNRYQKENTKCDLGASVRLSEHFRLYLASRNVFGQSHRIMEKSAGNPDVLYRYENYGTNWTFGITGSF